MNSQLTSNAEALRLFFTEDIFMVEDKNQIASVEPVSVAEVKIAEIITLPTVNVSYENLPKETGVVEEPMPTLKRESSFEFLGKNQKGILILVHDQENKVSTTVGTELLRKLVKAIELTNNDFALVNYAHYPTATFEDLKGFFNCQLVLSFGVTTTQLKLNEQALHQIVKLDETRFVFTKNLHDLDSDQLSKKTLWGSLQQLK
ncbi:hypothetical protein [Pedobacter sp. Hv1]|uniref:hypothetical protein n=1 Tax=Pedobacter sp. Hv1 TaxID=1740090 RepID=UPI0006D88C24|nr:hypothetical protein [Pedobacter sp. Hv1]KQB99756.1 hypothetical protein AQF98_14630 [Pedobacter sp. Hv1]